MSEQRTEKTCCKPPSVFPVWQCPRCLTVWISELCWLQLRNDRERDGFRRAIQKEFMERTGHRLITTRMFL